MTASHGLEERCQHDPIIWCRSRIRFKSKLLTWLVFVCVERNSGKGVSRGDSAGTTDVRAFHQGAYNGYKLFYKLL